MCSVHDFLFILQLKHAYVHTYVRTFIGCKLVAVKIVHLYVIVVVALTMAPVGACTYVPPCEQGNIHTYVVGGENYTGTWPPAASCVCTYDTLLHATYVQLTYVRSLSAVTHTHPHTPTHTHAHTPRRSLSFILVMAGTGYLVLALFYCLIDIIKLWTGAPFIFPGEQ